jgi:hypothetical protein
MKRTVWLSAAFAALVVAGCGEEPRKTPPPKPAAPAKQAAPAAAPQIQAAAPTKSRSECGILDAQKPNDKTPCVVTVSVTACADKGVTVDRDELVVKREKNAQIEWKMATTGYDFAGKGKGIVFKSPDSGKELEDEQPGKKSYKWKTRNNAPGKFKYDVEVLKEDGTSCARLDPYVVNEP